MTLRILLTALLLASAGCLPTAPERPVDDDDAGADDDDAVDDDDDLGDSPVATGLCAGAGRATSGNWTTVSCTGPLDLAPGVSTNGTYTVVTGTLSPLPTTKTTE